MSRHRHLERYSDFVRRHHRAVVLAGLFLAVLAASLALGLRIRSSRAGLAASEQEFEKRMSVFVEEFGDPEILVVIAESADPDEADRFADAYGRRLRSLPTKVRTVEWRLDTSYFLGLAPWRAPVSALESLADQVASPGSALASLARADGIASFDRALAEGLRRAMKGPAPSGGDEGAAPLARILEAERDFLRDPAGFVRGLGRRSLLDFLAETPGAGEEATDRPARGGYITSHDGMARYILVTPNGDTEDLPFLRPFLDLMRDEANALSAEFPGVAVSFAGQPAIVLDEMTQVGKDTWTTSLLGAGGVAVLAMFAFRRVRLALPVLAGLAIGAAAASGFAALWPGYLTVITSCFFSIIVGLGIDYGVHLTTQVEIDEDEGKPLPEAVSHSLVKTGPGVLTGGLTTALAFLSLLLMDFPGFEELGVLGAVGVVACLLAMLSVLPALLHLLRSVLEDRPRGGAHGPAPPPSRRNAGRALALAITARPWWMLLLWAVLLGLCAWEARGVRFDPNIRNLVPKRAAALEATRRLTEDPEFFPDFAISFCDNEAILRARQKACASFASVARCESALDYLPRDGEDRRPALRRIAGGLGIASWKAPEPAPTLPREAQAAHRELVAALGEAQELAFEAGRARAVEDLGRALEAAAESQAILDAATAAETAAWDAALLSLRPLLDGWAGELRTALLSEPPGPADLPPLLARRFLGNGGVKAGDPASVGGDRGPLGRSLLYLYPRGDVWEREVMEPFVRDAYEIDPEATGTPIVYHETTRLILRGFLRSSLAALLLVVVCLAIDFRDLRETVLALVPLATGILLLAGIMGATGLDFNVANLMVLPLILGIGVDNGVHILHRFRYEGREGMTTVVGHTGRAILISALTTMAGFGAMVFAHHRGMQSLGLLLFYGVGACLLTSMLLLPNLLTIYFRYRPEKSTAGMDSDE